MGFVRPRVVFLKQTLESKFFAVSGLNLLFGAAMFAIKTVFARQINHIGTASGAFGNGRIVFDFRKLLVLRRGFILE